MEVVHGLPQGPVDIILHSPGGSAEATEMIVHYLRSKFTHIRVIVPQAAMSAATLLACAADVITMGQHSALGPVDLQFLVSGSSGTRLVPAQAILDQFEKAKVDCQDPKLLGAWAPMLTQYGPALLVQCENALTLSQTLVKEWTKQWMFRNDSDGELKATRVADQLKDHAFFKSHSRHITRQHAIDMGLVVEPLENDQTFQDLVLSVFHAATHTFSATIAVKLIENHLGKAFVKLYLPPGVQVAPAQPMPAQSHKKRSRGR
jgi:ClpP class serine protease